MTMTTDKAIEIIVKEIERAAENHKKCAECDGVVTHPGAYFCEDCAKEFYEEGIDND